MPAPFRPMTHQRSPRRIVRIETGRRSGDRRTALRTSSRATTPRRPTAAGRRKSNFDDLAPARKLDRLDLLELLDAALHLRRLRRVRGEPLDEPLLLREHRLLARVRGLALRLAELPLALVEVVVAGVRDDLAAVDLDDPVHDPVHEIPVVAGHQQRRRTGLEELLEPEDRFDVEVIRRLVHQQHVGLAEQHLRHRDAHLPAAGQRARRRRRSRSSSKPSPWRTSRARASSS